MSAANRPPNSFTVGRSEGATLTAGAPSDPGRAAREPAAPPPPPPTPPPGARLRLGPFLAVAGLLAAAVAGIAYYLVAIAPYESTDDAFIEGRVIAIAPQVEGQVIALAVKDNQAVKKGELLLEIDARDYQVKVAQARAELAAAASRLEQARAQLAVNEAKAGQEQAEVAAAEADAARAQADLQRFQAVESRAVARSQIDFAQNAASTTAAQVAVAKNRAQAAAAQVELGRVDIKTAEANVELAAAAVRQAELNLSHTRVVAPEDGLVTHRTVEAGNYVGTGQPLLALVPRHLWVVANFKETQLTRLRPGQPVAIRVDAYPGRELRGHVDSIQAGAGARFSLLPPENATGNFVKVVQRVPVKIVFDDAVDPALPLGPGMSVVPVVRVK